jgi:hypothetical protein
MKERVPAGDERVPREFSGGAERRPRTVCWKSKITDTFGP